MKLSALIVTVAAVWAAVMAEEVDHKKRGVPKTSPINSIPGNGHEKPEALNFQSYQQAGPATQSPLYPLAPAYQQHDVQPHAQQYTQQPNYNAYIPQQMILPLQFIQQPLIAQPKFQLITTKSANGQTQLTLVPQGLVMNHLNFGAAGLYPFQQAHGASTAAPPQHGQSNYATPPPAAAGAAHAYYQPPGAVQAPLYLYPQSGPQLYGGYSPPQSSLYSPAGQQLLSYYQTNPQAKYQLLYGSSAQQPGLGGYQAPLGGSDYDKAVSGPGPQSLSSPKSDADLALNTNEYISPPDTPFRPISSYRGPGSYRN